MEGIRRRNYPKDYSAMEGIARLASVKSSNWIEGIVTTDERIREIVQRGGTPMTHPEEEIAGYRDALDMIHRDSGYIGFDRGTVLNLHSMLNAKGSEKNSFKNVDNAIISIDSQGQRHLVFEPVPASETEEHMEQLFLAYRELSTQEYEPLLYIPCIILDYLCIHPFLDGNGRTSRLITMLLLYREGIDVCRYVSMDEHIASTVSEYYASLRMSSDGWMENNWSYFPFIRYFLRMLLECYIDLDTRFAIVDGRKIGRTETVENVIRGSVAPISIRQIQAVLPDVSLYTIQKSVKTLLSEGKIEKVGITKGSRYRYVRKRCSRCCFPRPCSRASEKYFTALAQFLGVPSPDEYIMPSWYMA